MTDRKEILNFEHTHQELVDAIGNIAKVKNSEIALIAKKYAKLEAENARLRERVLKLEGLILYTDDALSTEQCGSDIQLKQWNEYRKHYSNDMLEVIE